MKTTGKPFSPINRTYDVVEILQNTNKTNEEYLRELKERNPGLRIIKVKKNKTYL